LVTGGNRGIGFEVAKALAEKDANYKVLLAARKVEEAKRAVEIINKPNLDAVSLDITSEESVKALHNYIQEKYPEGLDVLINNAGYATKGSEVSEKIARDTIGINYFGTIKVTNGLLDLVKKSKEKRLIMVSSVAGQLGSGYSEALTKRFLSDLSVEQIDEIAQEFFSILAQDKLSNSGFPASTYRVSKALLNAFSRYLHRTEKDIFIASVCPGWCKTDMGGANASRSAAKGAETIVWLATADVEKEIGKNGLFWRDKELFKW